MRALPVVRLLGRWMLPLLIIWLGSVAAASVIGAGQCCRVVAFTALNGFIYDIFTLDLALGKPYNLTRLPASANQEGDYLAGWSPDGRTLAFTSERGMQTGLYLMAASGRAVRAMPDDCLAQLSWSPDGRYLLCIPPPVLLNGAPRPAYLLPTDGSAAIPLTVAGQGTRFGSWSPAGRLLFDASDSRAAELLLLDPASGTRQALRSVTRLAGLGWRDARHLLVIAACGEEQGVILGDTTGMFAPCIPLELVTPPAWALAPNGRWLAFHGRCNGQAHVALLDFITFQQICLPGETLTSNLLWLPDSRALLWGTPATLDGQRQAVLWAYDPYTQRTSLRYASLAYERVVGLRAAPDGRSVSFGVLRFIGDLGGVFRLELAAGTLTEIMPNSPIQPGPPLWQP